MEQSEQASEVNNDEVICPNCCNQFRAVPVNVQALLLASGHEPPFVAPPQPAGESAGIADLARALVAKLDAVDPYMPSVFAMVQIRGCIYSGPTYGSELKALRAALATSPVRSAGG